MEVFFGEGTLEEGGLASARDLVRKGARATVRLRTTLESLFGHEHYDRSHTHWHPVWLVPHLSGSVFRGHRCHVVAVLATVNPELAPVRPVYPDVDVAVVGRVRSSYDPVAGFVDGYQSGLDHHLTGHFGFQVLSRSQTMASAVALGRRLSDPVCHVQGHSLIRRILYW